MYPTFTRSFTIIKVLPILPSSLVIPASLADHRHTTGPAPLNACPEWHKAGQSRQCRPDPGPWFQLQITLCKETGVCSP